MIRDADIGEWHDSKAAFLTRIAATTAILKIVLITKDDHHVLDWWITHHANIVGLENLVILDNMSCDERVRRIYQKYQTRVPIVRFREHFELVRVSRSLLGLYRCLKESCEFFAVLDTDEFLVHLRDTTYGCDSRILDILHSRRACDVIPGTWLESVPGFARRFRTGNHAADFASGLAWGKPIVGTSSFEPERPGYRNHNVDTDGSFYHGQIWLDFFIAHLKNLSVQHRIDANIRKLIAFEEAAPGATLESIVRRDPEDFRAANTRALAAELHALAARIDAPSAAHDAADESWLELAPHGRVLYSGEQQSRAMRAFQTQPQRVCHVILQTDSLDLQRHPDQHWRRWGEMFASSPQLSPAATARHTPVCVAGMTGTESSPIARILGIAGAHFGEPSDFSATGTTAPHDPWQDPRFVAINTQLLKAAGSGRDHPAGLPAGWDGDTRFAALLDEAKALVGAFVDVPSWGWHDPQSSLTLPFWQAAAGTLKCIICVRHPLDVAQSLRERHGVSEAIGLSLWTTYAERALADTRHEDRLVTHEDAWLDDPAAEVRRLLDFAGLDVSEETCDACRLAIENVTPPERLPSASDEVDLPPDVAALYRTLLIEAGRPASLTRRCLASPAATSPTDLAEECRELRKAVQTQAIVIHALTDENEGLRRRFEEYEASIRFKERLNNRLDAATPSGATVLVVSQGDDALVRLSGRQVLPFPQTPDGIWNGNPANSAEAIDQLETIRATGPTYLVLPERSRWWLEHYTQLSSYLRERCLTVFDEDATGVVFDLSSPER